METKKHNSLDDLVFENKNKAYGAYYNRVTAGFDLMKSLFITIFGIGALALVLSFTIDKKIVKPVIEGERIVPYTPYIPPKDDEKRIEKDKPIEKPKTIQSDKTNQIPTPKVDPPVQSAVLDNTDISTPVSPDANPNGSNAILNTDLSGLTAGSTENGTGTGDVGETNNTVYKVRDVAQMAIFPGCERFAGNNEKLQDCMSEQLQNELGNQLSDFENIAHRQNINEAMAKVQFIIDKSGKIIDVKPLNGGNAELSKEAKQALERISKRMVQKGKFIKPAKFEDGTAVNVMFAIPVRFISN